MNTMNEIQQVRSLRRRLSDFDSVFFGLDILSRTILVLEDWINSIMDWISL